MLAKNNEICKNILPKLMEEVNDLELSVKSLFEEIFEIKKEKDSEGLSQESNETTGEHEKRFSPEIIEKEEQQIEEKGHSIFWNIDDDETLFDLYEKEIYEQIKNLV